MTSLSPLPELSAGSMDFTAISWRSYTLLVSSSNILLYVPLFNGTLGAIEASPYRPCKGNTFQRDPTPDNLGDLGDKKFSIYGMQTISLSNSSRTVVHLLADNRGYLYLLDLPKGETVFIEICSKEKPTCGFGDVSDDVLYDPISGTLYLASDLGIKKFKGKVTKCNLELIQVFLILINLIQVFDNIGEYIDVLSIQNLLVNRFWIDKANRHKSL